MKSLSLMAEVRKIVVADPLVTNEQIFELVKPKFPRVSPVWMRNSIVHYRHRILKKANP